ncbi:phospholipase D family protein [Nocardioides plantarum]|uniref:PLD phosphodiesterase domain-containing protein n=1 Tax=Nocardioides plantarum TaxID=29299 RepID=A0ABV5KEE3_9ACTN|nr:phospholipase D family protein [Nocardioides plantarum]
MLDPEDRHLLTDALRPPAGHAVDAALATTYTLDLHTLLLAPLAMAAYDHSEGDAATIDPATPVALLESIRRHAQHTVVLCQAAGIHVPPTYPRLAAFAEGIVAEVHPPPGGTFHPKIWLLRFIDVSGNHRHRFVCLSRNLTGDRSWDTVLVCDEDDDAAIIMDAAPLVTFAAEVLEMLVRPLDDAKQNLINDLFRTFAEARLSVPAPFTAAEVLALGTPSGGSWPLPTTALSWMVISPFLDVGALGRLPRADGRRVLLSRSDTLDRVGRAACRGAETLVLQPMADVADLDELLDADDGRARQAQGPPPRGLHAKVFCWDDGEAGHVLTGSANCTGAAFGANIELSVHLTGPRVTCGPDALLSDGKSGLLQLAQAYECAADEGVDDPAYATERRIESWHAAIAAERPALEVTQPGDSYDVSLRLELPADPHGLAAVTTVRPVGLYNAQPLPVGRTAIWRGLGLHALGPYVVLSTTVTLDGEDLTRECVALCDVEGAPADRLRRLLRDLLSRQQDLLRYLTLLLGDLGADDLLDRLASDDDDAGGGLGVGFGQWFDDLVLLEPLIRAAARDDDALARAHRLLEDLRGDDGELPALDAEFLELWQVVWEGRHA